MSNAKSWIAVAVERARVLVILGLSLWTLWVRVPDRRACGLSYYTPLFPVVSDMVYSHSLLQVKYGLRTYGYSSGFPVEVFPYACTMHLSS